MLFFSEDDEPGDGNCLLRLFVQASLAEDLNYLQNGRGDNVRDKDGADPLGLICGRTAVWYGVGFK